MKKSATFASKAKSAVSALPEPQKAVGEVLGAARQPPATYPAPNFSQKYDIGARGPDKDGFWQLYNHDVPAGARLVKGGNFPLSSKTPGAVQPATYDEPWTHYNNEADAEAAAFTLQCYLDNYEARRSTGQ